VSLALYFVDLLLAAHIAQRLWLWFVSPMGVRSLGYAQAVGIVLLAQLLATDSTSQTTRTEPELAQAYFELGLAMLLIYALGALAHRADVAWPGART
jgi:hypothetical protein